MGYELCLICEREVDAHHGEPGEATHGYYDGTSNGNLYCQSRKFTPT